MFFGGNNFFLRQMMTPYSFRNVLESGCAAPSQRTTRAAGERSHTGADPRGEGHPGADASPGAERILTDPDREDALTEERPPSRSKIGEIGHIYPFLTNTTDFPLG